MYLVTPKNVKVQQFTVLYNNYVPKLVDIET